LKIEKSTMLLKITDLEEKLLEAQLQIESITDENLTQMLSNQKCPTDKMRLWYVAYTSDVPSLRLYLSSPQSSGLHPPVWIRERLLLEEKFQLLQSLQQCLIPREAPPHVVIVA